MIGRAVVGIVGRILRVIHTLKDLVITVVGPSFRGNRPGKLARGVQFALKPASCALNAVTGPDAWTALQALIRFCVADPMPAVVIGTLCWTGLPTLYRCSSKLAK